MTQLCQNTIIKRRILCRVSVLRRYISLLWNNAFACSIGKSMQYRPLPYAAPISSPSVAPVDIESGFASADDVPMPLPCCDSPDDDNYNDNDASDLVALKISLLGDCNIGKTSFLTKYAGKDKGLKELGMTGLNQVDKTLSVKGARIAYTIWELAGDQNSLNHIPAACKDSVAMIFMFDLTSRCTLISIINWYNEARKWNQTAMPVLVGTKFDDFVQLPIDLQWTIASQARAYAKALNATLFFSSATYNINVNKIFKFITAKLFNLRWSLERNLTIGEPIIDF